MRHRRELPNLHRSTQRASRRCAGRVEPPFQLYALYHQRPRYQAIAVTQPRVADVHRQRPLMDGAERLGLNLVRPKLTDVKILGCNSILPDRGAPIGLDFHLQRSGEGVQVSRRPLSLDTLTRFP
jgi:hypothetical protein